MSSKLSDYNLMSKTKPKFVEKINTLSKFYFPAKVSKNDSERLAESKKSKVFEKGKGVAEVTAVSLFYESFILAEGKSTLDYLRKKDYEFYVDETVHSSKVGNTIIKPVKADVGKKIRIPGVERINLTRVAKWLFNPMGGAQSLDFIPRTGKLKVTASWLKQHKKELVDPSITSREIVNMLKKSLTAKPADANRMISTDIRINLSTYYMPAYYVTYKRGEESKPARVDAVRGEITL
nr:hypothetical protein [Candidatus Freyarchaeota archaeon]